MMNARKLGICIIGCGFMGNIHAQAWNSLPEARIVAVVDILEERAQLMADRYGLERYYLDYHEAVSLPDVDVVSVCIPTYLHAEATLFAASQGKHVLCEKPMALRLEDTQAMIAAAQQSGIKLSLGFMRRHSPMLADLRKALNEDQLLGRPVLYMATDIREIRPKLAMHDAAKNGGPVIDMAVHLLDLWAYIFASQPVRVYAQGMTLATGRPELASVPQLAPDTTVLTATYASGDIGSFTVSWGLPPLKYPENLPDRIYGPLGIGEVEFSMAHSQPRHGEARVQVHTQQFRVYQGENAWQPISTSSENMYQREIATFARCILEDLPLPVTGLDGQIALRAALGALQSLHSGQPVDLTG